MRNRIYITREDMQRLQRLVDGLQVSAQAEGSNLAALEEELDRARIVDAKRIRPDVITLNSQVRVLDLDSGRVMEYEIVYPNTRPRSSTDALSVLAPLGTALLGYRVGDTIEWQVPKGKRRLKVIDVLYQPEAAGTPAA
ncbi:MAG: nucleoside diphosphate kinase regulator [Bryobacteraceae bacterium]